MMILSTNSFIGLTTINVANEVADFGEFVTNLEIHVSFQLIQHVSQQVENMICHNLVYRFKIVKQMLGFSHVWFRNLFAHCALNTKFLLSVCNYVVLLSIS
jgi:hypothetical protein